MCSVCVWFLAPSLQAQFGRSGATQSVGNAQHMGTTENCACLGQEGRGGSVRTG